jgi:monoterpene epsilon-lactone hydrolase
MIRFPLQPLARPRHSRDGLGARGVPARTVPLPSTASPELRAVIAAAPRAVISGLNVIDDGADVRRTVQAADKQAGARARGVWRRLGLTVDPVVIDEVKCFRVTPARLRAGAGKRLLIHLHDGGYLLNGAEAGTLEAALIASVTGTVAVAVDYRRLPDHPFPAALDDAVAVWRALSRDYAPGRTALLGASAGGGLAMATILKLKALGLPLPGALFLGAPLADLSKTGDTYFTNEDVDGQVMSYEGPWGAMLRAYAGARDLKDPLLSPLYGDLHRFPPTLLVSGTRDLLLSDTVRVHRKLRQAGVDADLHVFEGQSHHEYAESFPSPESQEALHEVARFLDHHLAH